MVTCENLYSCVTRAAGVGASGESRSVLIGCSVKPCVVKSWQRLVDQIVEVAADPRQVLAAIIARQVLQHQDRQQMLVRIDRVVGRGRAAPAELAGRTELAAPGRIE